MSTRKWPDSDLGQWLFNENRYEHLCPSEKVRHNRLEKKLLDERQLEELRDGSVVKSM